MSVPRTSALTLGNCFRASTAAFTKKDMKPSLIEYFFTNASWYCSRSSLTAVMSTSLKVVSSAAVCWASTRRSAMRRRSVVIGTISSWRPSCRAISAAELPGGAAERGGALAT
jgi:hypothetical protein